MFFCAPHGLVAVKVEQHFLSQRVFAASFLRSGRYGRRAHPPDLVQLLREGLDSIDHPRQYLLLTSSRFCSLSGVTGWRVAIISAPRPHYRRLTFSGSRAVGGESRLPGCLPSAKLSTAKSKRCFPWQLSFERAFKAASPGRRPVPPGHIQAGEGASLVSELFLRPPLVA